MKAVERLQRDHKILRAKLDVLESALRMGPQTWYVLRETCFTLSRQLRDHIRREDDLVAACRMAMNPKILAEVVVAHHDEPEHLRMINRLFVSEGQRSFDQIQEALTQVIEGLRRHMSEEEAELFPIFDRVLTDQDAIAGVSTEPPARFEETMTVNRIIQQCPQTKPVFEQLFINIPVEGCTCLDEVAWRHGVESRDLVHHLEEVAHSCECAHKVTATEESNLTLQLSEAKEST
ncbi:MAG: hemerythrin domain-containing protein [Candidatus Omnitrophica bacterium]|nr:hemerythrin domain-containing protein [Candidatus Omnitrophota bacterium]